MKESALKKLLEEKQIPYSFFLSFMKGKTYSVVDGEAEYYQHDLDSFFLFLREYLAYISPPILNHTILFNDSKGDTVLEIKAEPISPQPKKGDSLCYEYKGILIEGDFTERRTYYIGDCEKGKNEVFYFVSLKQSSVDKLQRLKIEEMLSASESLR